MITATYITMASPLSKSSFPSFHNDEEVKERPLSKVKPTQRPGSSGTKGRPTSASRALKNANQAYGGGPSVGKAAGLDSAQNDVLLSSMTRYVTIVKFYVVPSDYA